MGLLRNRGLSEARNGQSRCDYFALLHHGRAQISCGGPSAVARSGSYRGQGPRGFANTAAYERQGDTPPMMLRPSTPNLEMPSVHLLLLARDLLFFFVKARAHSEIGGVCVVARDGEKTRVRGLDSFPINNGAPRFPACRACSHSLQYEVTGQFISCFHQGSINYQL
jgi:hypothetical protein